MEWIWLIVKVWMVMCAVSFAYFVYEIRHAIPEPD